MLEEEAMAIKESLQDSSLDHFRALDEWLDTWKSAYAIKERRIVDETGDVAEETITSWMEKNQEFTKGFSSENIWNMDECGCFFKTLPDKGLVDQLFLSVLSGKKIDQPIVIWKSKKPRCFKRLSDKSRSADLHYFTNPKSWMTSDVMQAVLTRFNRKQLLEQRKVVFDSR